ncbi:MAG: hypothetical protein KKI08_20865 [Armatimonadetes bacterium]|nr:hypothetical protein [Armatimonadota bacterium]
MPIPSWASEPIRLWPERQLLDQCFVVMPIDKMGQPGYETYDDRIFSELIPAAVLASDSGLKVVRADSINRQDSITHIIMEQLVRSRLVIADLTWPNPNVWYEVGIRHAVCSGTVTMCQHGVKLPFDTKDDQTEFYTWRGDTSDPGTQDFCARLGSKINAALTTEPHAADSLMGRLLDHHMDYLAVLSQQATRYSPSAITLRAEHRAMERLCQRTLECIFLCLDDFLRDHDDRYGPPMISHTAPEEYCGNRLKPNTYGENWLTDLSNYAGPRRQRGLVCPLSTSSAGYCMNQNLAGRQRALVGQPDRVPFCYEDTLEQGADDTFAGTARHPRGHMVLFCDGQVKAVGGAILRTLKWSAD